jgi:hypothetical protein
VIHLPCQLPLTLQNGKVLVSQSNGSLQESCQHFKTELAKSINLLGMLVGDSLPFSCLEKQCIQKHISIDSFMKVMTLLTTFVEE